MPRAWFAVVLGLAACPKARFDGVEAAVAPPHDVSWREVVVIDGMVRLSYGVTQQWVGPRTLEDGRRVWRVLEVEQRPDSMKERARYDVEIGPDGYAYHGTVVEGGELSLWSPSERVLPADPKVGAHWEQTHTKDGLTITRSCEVLTSELCGGGLVSVCDASSERGRTIVREHFCPGVGWSGYESMKVWDGHSERRWSEELVRDGVRGPE